VEEDIEMSIEDIGVAIVAGIEFLLVAGVDVEVELVESFEAVTEVEVEVEVELVESFEVVELVESFEVVGLVDSFEVATEVVVVIVAGPMERRNCCWLLDLDSRDKSG
jgi:hypothetical protein